MLHKDGVKNVEPRDVNYYQPLWALVEGGIKAAEKSARPMKDTVDKTGAKWIQERVSSFALESNQTSSWQQCGLRLLTTTNDYPVFAAGLQIVWDKMPGLQERLEKEDSGVFSIYDYKYAGKAWKTFKQVRNLFKPSFHFVVSPTQWLLDDNLRRLGSRRNANFTYWTPGGSIFGLPYCSKKLETLRRARDVNGKFKHQLVQIDVDSPGRHAQTLSLGCPTNNFRKSCLFCNPLISSENLY